MMEEKEYDNPNYSNGEDRPMDIYTLMNALLTSQSGYIKKSRKRWAEIRDKFVDKVGKRAQPVTVVKSFDRDEACPRIEQKLTLNNFQQLMDRFAATPGSPSTKRRGLAWVVNASSSSSSSKKGQNKRGEDSDNVKKKPGQMTRIEFKRTMVELLGTNQFNRQLDEIFSKVDVTCDGLVDWEDFCTYTLLQYQELDYEKYNRESPFTGKPKFFSDSKLNKEIIIRILYITNSNRYATVSKDGTIGVWGVDLELLQSLRLSNTSEELKKKLNLWVTDAVYMQNVHKLAISTTSRDLYFLDTTTTTLMKQFHLFDLPSVPLCLDYWYDPLTPDAKSLLVYGDDIGNVTLVYFKKPTVALFDDPSQIRRDRTCEIFAKDIDHQSEYVQMQVLTDMHKDWVRRIKYLPTHSSIVSCSGNGRDSLVIRDIDRKKKVYTFRVTKGIDCFDVSLLWNIIATGSSDAVRLWNPYVTNKPVAVLKGHQLAIIDVVIHEDQGLVFSYAKEEALRIWCIKEHYCLHTINLKFPLDAHLPDHFSHVFLLQTSPLNTLLVTCNDVVAELKMQSMHQVGVKHRNVVTHSAPLCSVLYNRRLNQVVVGCTNALISVWDLNTGQRIIQFATAHDRAELSYMAFDAEEKRLLNACRDGSITIWNFTNGHCLHRLEPVSDDEVTGVIDIPEHNCFVSVGWSKSIAIYDKNPAVFHIDPSMDWKGGQLHKDDILCIAFCPPNLIATGSFDGEIIVWQTETESVFRRIRKSSNSRLSSRQKHSYIKRKYAPGRHAVEKLLFLKSRVNVRSTDCGHLISSQRGRIYFWNLYSSDSRGLASFKAVQDRDDSVLAIHVDACDDTLVTGDTSGNVSIWDISKYCLPDMIHRKEPPLLITWKAHDLSITSIKFINHAVGAFILTASVDQTARFWTAGGHFIGTFGQAIRWNLRDTKTYQHPRTPWDLPESKIPRPDRTTSIAEVNSVTGIDKTDRAEQDAIMDDDIDIEELIQHIPNVTVDSSKSVLSDQFSKNYERRMENRRRRRQDMGEIDVRRTVRFGKTCSPFQVIKTLEMEEFFLPRDTPMTPNMRGRDGSRNLFGFAKDNLSLPSLQSSQGKSQLTHLPLRNTNF